MLCSAHPHAIGGCPFKAFSLAVTLSLAEKSHYVHVPRMPSMQVPTGSWQRLCQGGCCHSHPEVWSELGLAGSKGQRPGLYHWNSGGGYAASFTGSFTSSSPAVASRTGSLSHSTLMKGFSARWEVSA